MTEAERAEIEEDTLYKNDKVRAAPSARAVCSSSRCLHSPAFKRPLSGRTCRQSPNSCRR